MTTARTDKALADQLAGLRAAEAIHNVSWRALSTYMAVTYPEQPLDNLGVLIAYLSKQHDQHKTPVPVMDAIKQQTVPQLRWLQDYLQAAWAEKHVPLGFDKDNPILLQSNESAVIIGTTAAIARFKRELTGWLSSDAAAGLAVMWLTGEEVDGEARLPNQALVYDVAEAKWKESLLSADAGRINGLHRSLGVLTGREPNIYVCPSVFNMLDPVERTLCHEAFATATPGARRIFFYQTDAGRAPWVQINSIKAVDVSLADDIYAATLREPAAE